MWNVWPCRRNDLIRKIKLISKFMTLQPTVSDKICGTNTNFINFFSHTPSPSPWTQCWFWKTFFQNLPDFKIEIKGRGVEIVKSVNFFCVPIYFVRDYLNKVLILKMVSHADVLLWQEKALLEVWGQHFTQFGYLHYCSFHWETIP